MHVRETLENCRPFSSGLASPLECTPNGLTLIGVACWSCDYKLCRFLVEAGVYSTQKTCGNWNCIATINIRALRPIEDKRLLYDLYRLFLDDAEDEFFDDPWATNGNSLGYGFFGTPEILASIQSHAFERYAEPPPVQRFERAIALPALFDTPRFSTSVRVAMGGGDSIDPAAFRLEDKCGRTLLHTIAHAIPADYLDADSDEFTEWQMLMKEAVSATPDLHKLGYFWGQWLSPLATSLFAISFRFRARDIQPAVKSIIQPEVNLYLREILSQWKLAGVDLEIFGAKEQALYSCRPFSVPVVSHLCGIHEILWGEVLYLQYGPEPEDWRLFVTNPIDELVGEFWESVEKSLEVMPGSWVD
ncbi:uncharacterized protein BDV17DRAFT_291213 [Aspergillus undulatus]|uniref:uncharacterized protein n=1 Tax=Aspergillus undulatus TaxID=1810928 RepID=UPI003CCCB56B